MDGGHFCLALCLHSSGIVQSLVGEGWATAVTPKTPVIVLVILEPLGWETDSVKKHLSPSGFQSDLLRIWTSAESSCTFTPTLPLSLALCLCLFLFGTVNLWNVLSIWITLKVFKVESCPITFWFCNPALPLLHLSLLSDHFCHLRTFCSWLSHSPLILALRLEAALATVFLGAVCTHQLHTSIHVTGAWQYFPYRVAAPKKKSIRGDDAF